MSMLATISLYIDFFFFATYKWNISWQIWYELLLSEKNKGVFPRGIAPIFLYNKVWIIGNCISYIEMYRNARKFDKGTEY